MGKLNPDVRPLPLAATDLPVIDGPAGDMFAVAPSDDTFLAGQVDPATGAVDGLFAGVRPVSDLGPSTVPMLGVTADVANIDDVVEAYSVLANNPELDVQSYVVSGRNDFSFFVIDPGEVEGDEYVIVVAAPASDEQTALAALPRPGRRRPRRAHRLTSGPRSVVWPRPDRAAKRQFTGERFAAVTAELPPRPRRRARPLPRGVSGRRRRSRTGGCGPHGSRRRRSTRSRPPGSGDGAAPASRPAEVAHGRRPTRRPTVPRDRRRQRRPRASRGRSRTASCSAATRTGCSRAR